MYLNSIILFLHYLKTNYYISILDNKQLNIYLLKYVCLPFRTFKHKSFSVHLIALIIMYKYLDINL